MAINSNHQNLYDAAVNNVRQNLYKYIIGQSYVSNKKQIFNETTCQWETQTIPHLCEFTFQNKTFYAKDDYLTWNRLQYVLAAYNFIKSYTSNSLQQSESFQIEQHIQELEDCLRTQMTCENLLSANARKNQFIYSKNGCIHITVHGLFNTVGTQSRAIVALFDCWTQLQTLRDHCGLPRARLGINEPGKSATPSPMSLKA